MDDDPLDGQGLAAPTPSTPPVVAVTVVFEPGLWFDQTLQALASQDYPNLRHLFLVAGEVGGDNWPLADRIHETLPDAHVHAVAGNPGYGATANEAMSLVEGDNGFFCFLHDDLALDANVISELVAEVFRSHAGIVGPKLVDWDDPSRLQDVGVRADRFGEMVGVVETGELDQEQHDAVADVFCLPSACMLVRADLFRALGGFNPAIDYHGDELDLCWRAHLYEARVLVVPSARARHRGQLVQRRQDLPHGVAAARHQLLTALTLSSRWRAFTTFLLAPLVALIDIVSGLFAGRAGHGVASLRAVVAAVPRLGAVAHRRRRIKALRKVPNREVTKLQVRGSARLGALFHRRAVAETTKDRTRAARRPLRSAGKAAVTAWTAVLVLFAFGSREIITKGMPEIGNFLAIPQSGRELWRSFASGWWPSGFGHSEAAPTGTALLAGADALSFGWSGLLRTLLVLGPIFAGFVGIYHFSAVFRNDRSRVFALVAYAANPLPYAAIASGRWGPLAVYGAFPWALELLRRASGLQAASSLTDAEGAEVTDAVSVVGVGRQIRVVAALTLLDAVVAAFVPSFPLLVLAAGIFLALGTLAVRGSATTIVGAGAAAIAAVGAFILHLPWSARFLDRGGWDDLVGGGQFEALGIARLSRFEIGPMNLSVFAVALTVPLVVAVLISRGWRLTWAARCGALVIGFGLLTLVGDRGGLALPEPGVLLVPVAAGLAIATGCAVAAFDAEVRGGRIGWEQPVALLTFASLAIAAIPAVVAVGDGKWRAPDPELAGTLGALPHDPPSGDFRILYLGDQRVIPIPARPYGETRCPEPQFQTEPCGVAFAISDDGALDVRDLWPNKAGSGEALVEEALDAISSGATLRGGRMLAPLGIRYIVVPIIDGLQSTRSDTVPLPRNLQDAFGDQLDLRQSSYVSDLAIVYENTAVIPLRSTLTGAAQEASLTAGAAALVRSDLDGASPLLVGQAAPGDAQGQVPAGTFHDSVPYDERWDLTVGGQGVPSRSAFGWSMGYEVPADGEARLAYDTPTARTLFIALLAVLWTVTLLATSRFAGWRRWWNRRRRGATAPVISLASQRDPAGVGQ